MIFSLLEKKNEKQSQIPRRATKNMKNFVYRQHSKMKDVTVKFLSPDFL